MDATVSKELRHALVGLLVAIAKADGEIQEGEAAFLDDYSSGTGINWREFPDRPIDTIVTDFKEHYQKVAVLQELVKLAMTDGDYSDAERAGIHSIAKRMSIAGEKVLRIEDWVRQGLDWVSDGIELRKE